MLTMLGIGDQCVDRLVYKKMLYPGGNAANVAVHAARMGARAGFLGAFGDDDAALYVHSVLREERLDLSHCRYTLGENAHFDIKLVDGDRIIYNDCDGALEREPLRFSALDDAYIRAFFWIHSGCYCHIEAQLEHLAALGPYLTYDFSDSSEEGYMLQYARHLYAACYSSTLDEDALRAQMQRLRDAGAQMVLATRGSQGALLLDGENWYAQSPCLVKPVDTTGAGDSFIAGFFTAFFAALPYIRTFPEGKAGLTGAAEQRDALIRASLYRAAVYAADNCLVNGGFGHGNKWENNEV